MPKEKVKSEPEAPPVVEVTAAAGEACPDDGAVRGEEQPELPYTVGKWQGYTQWQCRLCPWDTLEGEEAIWEHIQARHAPPPAPPLVQAYSAGGHPIEFARR